MLRQDWREIEVEFLLLGALEVELRVPREVIVVAELDAMLARVDRDAGLDQVDRADELAVDVDLGVGEVRGQVHDRVVRGHPVRGLRAAARAQQREDERLPHGAPESATSTMSLTIFTLDDVSGAGGFFAICATRSIDSPVVTPITQPAGDSRRRRAARRAPSRTASSRRAGQG